MPRSRPKIPPLLPAGPTTGAETAPPSRQLAAVASNAPCASTNEQYTVKHFDFHTDTFIEPISFLDDIVGFPQHMLPSESLRIEDTDADKWELADGRPPRSSSTTSLGSAVSSGGWSFSFLDTEASDSGTIRTQHSREPSPQNKSTFSSGVSKRTSWDSIATVKDHPTFTCSWAGCSGQSCFKTHEDLVWHVKTKHLLICPSKGCSEGPFGSSRMVEAHLAVVHPDVAEDTSKDWQLQILTPAEKVASLPPKREEGVEHIRPSQPMRAVSTVPFDGKAENFNVKKRKCQDQLKDVLERKAKKARKSSVSSGASDPIKPEPTVSPSFPMVWEHAILPFLIDFIPRCSTPRHIISTTRGKTPGLRRINITTQIKMSRCRKITIARHVLDLLPNEFHDKVSFVFSVGEIIRSTWARGLSQSMPDDICHPKNPYMFHTLCMGDSIGVPGCGPVEESTATLGPCITIDRGSYWLGNFHPFLEAYQSRETVTTEHPSAQDRKKCIESAHDCLQVDDDFRIGDVVVTSGLNLKTTRISHDPYWEDMCQDGQLLVTDWALISSSTSNANILRRFPSDTHPGTKAPLITETSSIIPGATVISSGRTSGYQKGQICDVPAYVSGDENGTQKATREWFIEELCGAEDEEAWIRGGIGVEGDSGAAVVDAETDALYGQVWGRNRYWGPGPRIAFFTPIADIFDDIQEKCGQQTRPQLPQYRDDGDRYPVYPTCRQCYDLQTYLNSRRSSRISLQSMIMGHGDGDQDITSTEAASELMTPRDHGPKGLILEEIGASFTNVLSPSQASYARASTPVIADLIRSPYAQVLELDDVQDSSSKPGASRKRGMPSPSSHDMLTASPQRFKRPRPMT